MVLYVLLLQLMLYNRVAHLKKSPFYHSSQNLVLQQSPPSLDEVNFFLDLIYLRLQKRQALFTKVG